MEIRRVLVILTVIVSIALAACAPTSVGIDMPTDAPLALPTEISTQTPSPETASDVDLKNGTYLIDGQSITLVNGVAETELAPGSASKQVASFFGRRSIIPSDAGSISRCRDSFSCLSQCSLGAATVDCTCAIRACAPQVRPAYRAALY